MADNDFNFKGDFVPYIGSKIPIVFVLDTSGSMNGEPIMELNKGLKIFEETIKKHETALRRVEVAVVSFGSIVKVEHDFAHIQNFQAPTLYADGLTNMVDGIKKAIELIEQQKEKYNRIGETYYRPMIVLMTDGEPYPDTKEEIMKGSEGKHFKFWAVGIGNYINMDFLIDIAYKPNENNHNSSIVFKNIQYREITNFFNFFSDEFLNRFNI